MENKPKPQKIFALTKEQKKRIMKTVKENHCLLSGFNWQDAVLIIGIFIIFIIILGYFSNTIANGRPDYSIWYSVAGFAWYVMIFTEIIRHFAEFLSFEIQMSTSEFPIILLTKILSYELSTYTEKRGSAAKHNLVLITDVGTVIVPGSTAELSELNHKQFQIGEEIAVIVFSGKIEDFNYIKHINGYPFHKYELYGAGIIDEY